MQPVEFVEEKDGIITLRDHDCVQGWTGTSVFVCFPDEVFSQDVSADTKRAVLLERACEDPGSIGQLLLNAFLKRKFSKAQLFDKSVY